MYSLIKECFISDIANLILINYWKLNQIDFKDKILLFKTRVYVFNQTFIDVGLSNIRAVNYNKEAYYAISYDDDLYVWGKNNFIINNCTTPKLALKSVKKIFTCGSHIAIINNNDEFHAYGCFPKSILAMLNVKDYINGYIIVYKDDKIYDSINGSTSLYYMINNNNQLMINGKLVCGNVKDFKVIGKYLYVLTTNNTLYRRKNVLLVKIADNVKYITANDKYLFVSADKRSLYVNDDCWEVNYDVFFGDKCRVTVEGSTLTFYGDIFDKLICKFDF